jgi:hypothetical protein
VEKDDDNMLAHDNENSERKYIESAVRSLYGGKHRQIVAFSIDKSTLEVLSLTKHLVKRPGTEG